MHTKGGSEGKNQIREISNNGIITTTVIVEKKQTFIKKM